MTDKTDHLAELKLKIREFPRSSGVYVMRNARGSVIYVGKAKNLRARVGSYFAGEKDVKTAFLIDRVRDIEVILTANEYEALVLENNLIKKHRPRFNINLKDGKSYPVIRITDETFPRVFRTRTIVRDGSTYFGPYPDVKAVDLYIELIRKLFPLRRCRTLKNREAPCLYHHIGRCPAPCVGKITEDEYGKTVRKVRSLLSGRTAGLRKELEREMQAASAALAFEKAAELRDGLAALDVLDAEPTVMDFREESRDYVGRAISGRLVVFAVMQMRGGKILGREIYVNEYAGDPAEALPEFLALYYAETGRETPDRLYLYEDPGALVREFFRHRPGGREPAVAVPKSKRDRAVLAMVAQNAEAELDRRIRDEGDIPALEELKRVLSLPKTPKRIEGFDISQLGGRHTVASLISFLDGRPDRAGYRHYRIRSTAGGVDDYKAIAEVVGRRYQRVKNEGLPRPDLILVDGGKGQVSAARSVLKLLDMADEIPLVGLAKKEEELWLPDSDSPVRLPEGDPGLRILQQVRDETHRFATGYNKRLREKGLTLSTLEGVPGIGAKRSRKLLTTFGSLEHIYEKSAEDIAATAGVGLEVAETVKDFLAKALESREVGRAARER